MPIDVTRLQGTTNHALPGRHRFVDRLADAINSPPMGASCSTGFLGSPVVAVNLGGMPSRRLAITLLSWPTSCGHVGFAGRHFNPRPRAGGDVPDANTGSPLASFQSAPRAGGDKHGAGGGVGVLGVSIRAPRAGAT